RSHQQRAHSQSPRSRPLRSPSSPPAILTAFLPVPTCFFHCKQPPPPASLRESFSPAAGASHSACKIHPHRSTATASRHSPLPPAARSIHRCLQTRPPTPAQRRYHSHSQSAPRPISTTP